MTTTRDARPDEAPAVLEVVRAAFGDEGEQVAALWPDLQAAGLVRASLVAEHDGVVVGHVGLSHAWVDARRALVEVLLLSPLSVRPAQQGEGVGTTLVAAALERARGAGAVACSSRAARATTGPVGSSGRALAASPRRARGRRTAPSRWRCWTVGSPG